LPSLLFYTESLTPRLQYMVDFFGEEVFNEPIEITTDTQVFRNSSLPRLNYSERDFSEKEFFIRPVPLLFEKGIQKQYIECFELNFHKAFFETKGDLSFDIFAATFYLIARYEEYLPHQKDEFGRFAHTESLAYKEDFLRDPLVNIWIDEFKKELLRKYPSLQFRRKHFKCALTYDIDIAWAYKHRDTVRTLGGIGRSLVTGRWKELKDRCLVMNGNKSDPYDCFEWLDALHLYCRVKPYYFFLVAKHKGKYDKNISTETKAFRDLIEYYAQNYKTGLHPSWQSGDDEKLLTEEKEWLEVVADKQIIHSRQHYIRLTLPATYRRLMAAGLEKDYSMGYGSINGFRASVCSSYYWYDLEKETATRLRIYPFCFMDANSYFEQKDTTARAYNELMHFYQQAKKHQGIFISIWHNNILGTDPQFAGWRELFELFMKETVYWDAYNDEG